MAPSYSVCCSISFLWCVRVSEVILPEGRIRLLPFYAIPLSSFCGVAWRHCVYEMVVRHILPRVCLSWYLNTPGPVNSPRKWSVTGKMFPFGDVIMCINLSNTRYWAFSWHKYAVMYSRKWHQHMPISHGLRTKLFSCKRAYLITMQKYTSLTELSIYHVKVC